MVARKANGRETERLRRLRPESALKALSSRSRQRARLHPILRVVALTLFNLLVLLIVVIVIIVVVVIIIIVAILLLLPFLLFEITPPDEFGFDES